MPATVVPRVVAVVGVLAACLPAAAEPRSTVATPGDCTFSVRAAPRPVPGHPRLARWVVDAGAVCAAPQVDLRVSADLTRNHTSVPGTDARRGCATTDGHVCTAAAVRTVSPRAERRGVWQPRLVAFFRGAGSAAQWTQDDRCVIDIPTFVTICTVLGDEVAVR